MTTTKYDTISRLRANLSGKPDEKQQGIAVGLQPPDLVYHTNAHREQRLDLSIEAFDVDSSMDMPATTLMRLKVLYPKFSLASRPRQRVGCAPEDDTGLFDMRNSEHSRKEIYTAFPHRTSHTLHVLCSTRLKMLLAKGNS